MQAWNFTFRFGVRGQELPAPDGTIYSGPPATSSPATERIEEVLLDAAALGVVEVRHGAPGVVNISGLANGHTKDAVTSHVGELLVDALTLEFDDVEFRASSVTRAR